MQQQPTPALTSSPPPSLPFSPNSITTEQIQKVHFHFYYSIFSKPFSFYFCFLGSISLFSNHQENSFYLRRWNLCQGFDKISRCSFVPWVLLLFRLAGLDMDVLWFFITKFEVISFLLPFYREEMNNLDSFFLSEFLSWKSDAS